jgi:hypothetical protein
LRAKFEKAHGSHPGNTSADHCEKKRTWFSQWSVVIKLKLPSRCDTVVTIVKKMCVTPSTFYNGQVGPANYLSSRAPFIRAYVLSAPMPTKWITMAAAILRRALPSSNPEKSTKSEKPEELI